MRRFLIIIAAMCAFLPGAVLGQSAASGKFKVLVESQLDDAKASNLQRSLQSDGYTPVEKAESGGKYSVLVGAAGTAREAQGLLNDLKSAGYNPEKVQSPSEAGESRTVSTAVVKKVYRVLVSDVQNKEAAEQAKKTLVSDDYFGVDLVQEGNSYKVYIGSFPTEDEAQKMSASLIKDGYSFAKVVSIGEADSTGAPPVESPTMASLPSNIADKLSPEEQQQATDLITRSQAVGRGGVSASEIAQLREDLKKVKSDVSSAVKAFTSNEQERRQKASEIRNISNQFDVAIKTQNWDEAARKLLEMRTVSPDDPLIEFKQERFNMARGGTATAAGGKKPAAPVGPDPQRVAAAVADARSAEARKDYEVARSRWYDILAMDPQNAEAKAKVEELKTQIDSRLKQAQSTGGGSLARQNLILYGAGGAVVLVLGIFGFMLMQNSRREKDLLKQVQDLASHTLVDEHAATMHLEPPVAAYESPSDSTAKGRKVATTPPSPVPSAVPSMAGGSNLFGSSLGAPDFGSFGVGEGNQDEEPTDPPEVHVPSVEEHHIAPPSPPGVADVVNIAGIFDTPASGSVLGGPDIPAPPFPSMGSESVDIGGFDIPMPGADFPSPPNISQSPSELKLPDLNFEEMLKQPFPGAKSPSDTTAPGGIGDIPAVPAYEMPTVPVGSLPSIAVEPPIPTGTSPTITGFEQTRQLPAAPPPEAPQAPQGPVASNGLFLAQDFDAEPVGTQPEGWQGEYDYATLTVDDKSPSEGSSRCLRFEKRSGAGSANYVCRFPNASGQVIVEFDMRCDDKNKYLLGFYIEKDEDFKQSVHTIVHRTDSKSQPSLRIQGEPIPYEFGAWRHIKYSLNLLSGVVNAYVDGQQIVKDAKLPTAPPFVNTLSIRDNLATTGLLYLDNIKIYKG